MIDKIKHKGHQVIKLGKDFQTKVKGNIATAISAAFAFIIALYWKDIVVEVVDKIILAIGLKSGALWLRVIAAVIATAICVAAIYFVSKWGSTEKPSA